MPTTSTEGTRYTRLAAHIWPIFPSRPCCRVDVAARHSPTAIPGRPETTTVSSELCDATQRDLRILLSHELPLLSIRDEPRRPFPYRAWPRIGATVLRSASLVGANVVLLATVFLNMLSMHALVWTYRPSARTIIGILYGTSLYLPSGCSTLRAAQCLGASLLRCVFGAHRSRLERIQHRRRTVLAATAYIALLRYGVFALAYLLATSRCASVVVRRRTASRVASSSTRGRDPVVHRVVAFAIALSGVALRVGRWPSPCERLRTR